ncbi:ATP-binding protein [Streptomyces flavovirens]|uniref:ATP-binding protein n=1 Tax=Streptomyces TaxID=1883 RepID=UPI000DACD5B6|nr:MULTISPECIES: ATP-binding protein [unclassified Streptomyces]MYU32921.1 ATP-binding protein [Streptomyces sp. SID8358]MYX76474.1 ATP-binding protein [Streptomyces sp. SID3915]
MSMWWSLHLRREAASVPLARRFLLGTMETAGVDPDISYDLSVALSEACANAVEHGGRPGAGEAGDADPGQAVDERSGQTNEQYRVTAYLDGEKCRIEVADSGPGFPARRTLRTAAHPSAGQPSDSHLPAGQPSPGGVACAAPPGEPPSIMAESGRGLCLIEELADHVTFGNRPGRGAVVSFDKVLKWREGALLMVS